jgi:hypothetical protein
MAKKADGVTCAPVELVELQAATYDFLKALANPTRQRTMLLFAAALNCP